MMAIISESLDPAALRPIRAENGAANDLVHVLRSQMHLAQENLLPKMYRNLVSHFLARILPL
jgi:hypothetical protein